MQRQKAEGRRQSYLQILPAGGLCEQYRRQEAGDRRQQGDGSTSEAQVRAGGRGQGSESRRQHDEGLRANLEQHV